MERAVSQHEVMQGIAAFSDKNDEEQLNEDIHRKGGIAAEMSESIPEHRQDRSHKDAGRHSKLSHRHKSHKDDEAEDTAAAEGFPEGSETGPEHTVDSNFLMAHPAGEAGNEGSKLDEGENSQNDKDHKEHQQRSGIFQINEDMFI